MIVLPVVSNVILIGIVCLFGYFNSSPFAIEYPSLTIAIRLVVAMDEGVVDSDPLIVGVLNQSLNELLLVLGEVIAGYIDGSITSKAML